MPWIFSDFDKVQTQKNEKSKWGPPSGSPSSLVKDKPPKGLPLAGGIFKPNPTATRKQMLPDARGATLWRVWGGGWQHLGVWGVGGYSTRALEPPTSPRIGLRLSTYALRKTLDSGQPDSGSPVE